MAKSNYVNFKALKENVSIKDVMDHYGLLEKLSISGDNASGSCPICQSESKDVFRISFYKNIWNCFADCPGGNILDFVAHMEDTSIREAGLLIQEWFNLDTRALSRESKKTKKYEKTQKAKDTSVDDAGEDSLSSAPTDTESPTVVREKSELKVLNKNPKKENPSLTFTLQSLDVSHPYLAERLLFGETVDVFGLGYCKKGIMRGRVVIPIHNAEGELVAYAGRVVDDEDGREKYSFPKGFFKNLELFNFHRMMMDESENPLVIVEGFFDCIYLWELGYKKTVALMGTHLSDEQFDLLGRALHRDDKIFVLLDSDEAGIEASKKIVHKLSSRYFVKNIRLPEPDTDADDCTEDVLNFLMPLS